MFCCKCSFIVKKENDLVAAVAYAGKNFGGSRLWPALEGVRGGAHRTPENFRKFVKDSLIKLQKCSIFAYFAKKVQNPAFNFRPFGRKTQLVEEILSKFWYFWWKFNRKIEILSIFGKSVAKNRNFGNNIIFLQQFFRFGGVWTAYATELQQAAWQKPFLSIKSLYIIKAIYWVISG